MIQATSCPSSPILHRLLLGQNAEKDSISLVEHLLACEKCLQTLQTLAPEDTLIPALQQGNQFAAPAPPGELLEKLRQRLRELPHHSRRADTASAKYALAHPPTPASDPMDADGVSLAPRQLPDEIGRLGELPHPSGTRPRWYGRRLQGRRPQAETSCGY